MKRLLSASSRRARPEAKRSNAPVAAMALYRYQLITPAISTPASSTSTGTLKPNSAMEAAICAIWSSECVLALAA